MEEYTGLPELTARTAVDPQGGMHTYTTLVSVVSHTCTLR